MKVLATLFLLIVSCSARAGPKLYIFDCGALYFDESTGDWFSYRISDGLRVNLTERIANVEFWREDHDTPDLPPPYGSAGWTENDATVLLYDKYDIWEVRPDGSSPRNLTGGEGRKQKTQIAAGTIHGYASSVLVCQYTACG